MSDYPLDFTPQCPQVYWLAGHLGGWQFGEQGLLLAVMDKLAVFSDYADLFRCIEIGAGDGEELPLTIDRFYEAGAECLLFESDDKSRAAISKKYPLAKVDGAFVGQELPPSVLVVIDIDSHDSQIMQQVMKRDRPAIVVCEHMDRCYPIGTSAPSPFPVWSLGHELTGGFRIQDTAETLQWMAGNLGYERFGFNRCNSFFVRQDRFADLFR